MQFKSMQDIVTAVQRGLYQSAGPQVQLYSEEIIMQMVQDAFDDLAFGKDWWPHLIKREIRTLNGTTGEMTSDLSFIQQYGDIRYVFRNGSKRPLPVLPMASNTLDLSGDTPKFIEPTDSTTKLFRIWPLASTGDILVVGRSRPASDYTIDAEQVAFDHLALRYYALWSYFTDDEAIQSAAKYRKLLDDRLNILKDAAFSGPIVLDPDIDSIPTQWGEGRF